MIPTPASRAPLDPWTVGFSPAGDAMPDSLAQVLARGSHAVVGARLVEERRRERAAAIAAHVENQIEEFLAICAAIGQAPPVVARLVAAPNGVFTPAGPPEDGIWTPGSWSGAAGSRSRFGAAERPGVGAGPPDPLAAAGARASWPSPPRPEAADEDTAPHPPLAPAQGQGRGRGPGQSRRERRERRERRDDRPARVPGQPKVRRGRVAAWPILYWRNQGFLTAGRSLHLFIDARGQTFEGPDDPGPATALGREIRAWPVDTPAVVRTMAEIDARRCAHQIVHAMAHLLWRAGVSL